MQTQVLIIGQGISGTFLSYYLYRLNIPFIVIDNPMPNAPSAVAAGVINPVTGRRLVTVWLANEILPFAWNAYTEMGAFLNTDAISQKPIIDFYPNPFMQESYQKKWAEDATYINLEQEQDYSSYFNYHFGYGTIQPAYTAHLQLLLPAWRQFLRQQNLLIEEKYNEGELIVNTSSVTYKNITADKIIYCDGGSSAGSRYFNRLPFALNKGEAIIVDIHRLPDTHIYKKSLTLVPLPEKNRFWLGSAYLWDYTDDQPSKDYWDTATAFLNDFVKLPYTIIDHKAAIRPATLERRPFVGMHPVTPAVGLLNGMGTKGCSLAPYFAWQLANNIANASPILPEADIKRFEKVLSR